MVGSRRDFMKLAAAGGATLGVSCAREDAAAKPEADEIDNGITTRTIAEAEKLQGIAFTPEERAMMLDGLEDNLKSLAALRAHETPNNLAPALIFDPRTPNKRVGSQKNDVSLGGDAAPYTEDERDIAFASLADLGRWLREGKVTSAALTDLYLSRIDRHDPRLQSFITLTPEIARAQAAKADADFAEGRDRGPLHGIPYGLKDLADTKGVRTTWGARPFMARTPETDAEVVVKLQRAGAVMLGKTACGAIAYGDQWYGGVTKNPWNTAEGSSGSSAGSASAVAAGLCGFAIGTETLGSIVSPSERCGTAGLRPTFGRVSRAGFMALCWSLDKVGPICRTVEDTALVMSAINGFDADDHAAARVGFAYDGAADLSGFTVGYVPAWFEQGDDVDRAALGAARASGATLKEIEWPAYDFEALVQVVLVEAAAAFSDLTLSDRDDELVWQAPEAWPNAWRQARFISAVDYVQIDRLRRKLMNDLSALFETFDVMIGPHDGGGALLATNACGQPQLALRAGFAQTPTRLRGEGASGGETFRTPRAISLWADIFREGPAIRLGHDIERRLGAWRERPPGF